MDARPNNMAENGPKSVSDVLAALQFEGADVSDFVIGQAKIYEMGLGLKIDRTLAKLLATRAISEEIGKKCRLILGGTPAPSSSETFVAPSLVVKGLTF